MTLYTFFLIATISVGVITACEKYHSLDNGDVVITDQGTGTMGKCEHKIESSRRTVFNIKCDTFSFPTNGKNCKKEWMEIQPSGQKTEQFCGEDSLDFTTDRPAKTFTIVTKGKDFNYQCTVSPSELGVPGASGPGAQLNYTGCGIKGSDDTSTRIQGGQDADVGERIQGGQDADVGEWPWQVSYFESGGVCGGTILTETCVLTAAHCIANKDPESNGGFSVFAGMQDKRTKFRDPNVQERQAEKVFLYPDSRTGKGDIAVIKLRTAFDFTSNAVDSACLPTEGYTYAGEYGTATGYGRTSKGGDRSPTLQEVRYPIHDNSDKVCRNKKEHILCAAAPGLGTGKGDSGGPIVVQGPDSKWSVVGSSSYSVSEKDGIVPDFYMRVSYYLDFIKSHCG